MDPSVSMEALEERKSYVPTGNRKTVPWWSTFCCCTDWAIVVKSFEISVNEVCGHVFCLCYSIIGIGAWILDVTKSRRTCSPTEPVNVLKPRQFYLCKGYYIMSLSISSVHIGWNVCFYWPSCLGAWTISVCIVTDHVYLPCRCLIVFTQVKSANVRIITKYYGACPRLRLLLYQGYSNTIV
jgi:hypothetical protein